MKPTFCMFFFCLVMLAAHGQDRLSQFVDDGVDLHQRGYYEEAIAKYDSALRQDAKHYRANYEKALSLSALKRYSEAAALCSFLLDQHPDSSSRLVYVLYGTLLDFDGNRGEAVRIYTKGIARNPGSYLLYFNRAVTYYQMEKTADAEADLTHALARNPYHAGSHNLLALMREDSNPVYSLLATTVFLALEPQGERAKAGLKRLDRLMGAGVKQKDEKNIQITLAMPSGNARKQENDFNSLQLMISLTAATTLGQHKDETHAERIRLIMSSAIASLSLHQKEGRGFGWKFYAPLLSGLEEAGHLEAWAHLACSSDNDSANTLWLTQHKEAVTALRDWLNSYNWPKNVDK